MTVDEYIRRIRKPAKRLYAEAYARWLRNGAPGDEPERPDGLGYMGAQAVRMELESLSRDATT